MLGLRPGEVIGLPWKAVDLKEGTIEIRQSLKRQPDGSLVVGTLWVTPCPIGEEEINRKKAKRHRKSRMDARTRERLPVLPVVVRSVAERRTATASLLEVGRRALPGDTFSAAGMTLVRAIMKHPSRPGMVWAHDPNTGHRRDLVREEDSAFWAWAIVEVLRSTGIRAEELLELSHHALVQYRLPTTDEMIPLLQIVPSKTDTERLLVISPELAEVLGAIILRVSDGSGTVPLVPFYDEHERVWRPPAPLLFQRYVGSENRAITPSSARLFISSALAHTGLVEQTSGMPLRYTPHDFRRMMITDVIMNGLPPHIAQVIAGHQDINVTLGYKAVYPEEAIQAHLAFLARRRSLRPSDEYRTPTDDEWQEFLGHFERRKVSIGTCARAFSTPCIHEHACVRCPMLWPDPEQRPRLVDIRDNLTARIAEAEREGWLGEIEGLQVSLAGAEEKLTQMEHRRHLPVAVHFGAPATTVTKSDPHVGIHR
jgi:integrase